MQHVISASDTPAPNAAESDYKTLSHNGIFQPDPQHDLEAFDRALADEPPDKAIDPLIQTAIELGGVVVEQA